MVQLNVLLKITKLLIHRIRDLILLTLTIKKNNFCFIFFYSIQITSLNYIYFSLNVLI